LGWNPGDTLKYRVTRLNADGSAAGAPETRMAPWTEMLVSHPEYVAPLTGMKSGTAKKVVWPDGHVEKLELLTVN
jgi:hypothetical protein